ncbi:MAG: BTAD domain-containing putative transcriptional regulator [Acidimicrobiales bacterium]
MDVRVLGPIELEGADGEVQVRGPIPRTVLGVLIAMAGSPVPTDRLIMEVYGEDAGDSRRRRIEDTVSSLRAMLGTDRDRLRFGTGGYHFDVAVDAIDAERFEQLVEQARRQAPRDARAALRCVDEALALWRGDPYGGTRSSELLEAERRRLRELRGTALEEQCELQVRLGQLDTAVSRLAQLCGDAELANRERLWTLRMRALYAAGRPQDALQVAREAERRLAEAFLVPSPAFRELESRILAHDPAVAPTPERLDACPYKGLEAYQTQDAHLFHGRDGTIDELLVTLAATRLVVVTGRSGAGKSSVVRAGLVPALRRGRLSVPYADVVLTPGEDPASARRALDVALHAAPDGRPALLVIDQAEEVFTLGWEPADADRYLDRLAGLAAGAEPLVRVVIVVRDDLLGRLLEHPRLTPRRRGSGAGADTVVVTPMGRPGLREAIRRPAASVGLQVDDELVERLLDEASTPGALPLLSHALLQTWRYADRRRGVLTVADYERTGGLHAAVGRTADEVYGSMDGASQQLLRRLLLELVELGAPGGPDGRRGSDSRRPATIDSLLRLGDADEVVRIVEDLVAARLLSVGAGGFELVHEALLTSWPKLAGWIEAEREELATARHLAADAAAWYDAGRDRDLLYRGGRLERAQSLLGERSDAMVAGDPVVAAFIHAGTAQQVATQRERRVRRWSVGVAAVLVAAMVGAVTQRAWGAAMEERARRQTRALSPLVAFDGPDGPFALERFEVRVGQYRRCVEQGACSPVEDTATVSLLETAPSDAPITFVSFRQARAYCRWLGRRLPTRAELEWAITLGGERPYPWGAQDPLSFELDEAPLLLEVMVRSLDGEVRTGLPLRPVTAGPSSAEGLVNLVGNVAEWTATERSPVEVVVSGLSARDEVATAAAGAFSYGRVLAGDEDVGIRCAADGS